ncbi:autotransporter domain-containing protein [Peteryoungia ipomoeae]|uniref:Autotransporter domain-containing protein n=1 Tax=Peteryoungia ipomoeae TaxID=1210932 RepID=A0A4S8P2L7_9HYPH|nr:autotransporter domain-containing protein [Peteryoungia ipomoeae]THV22972.1 autotransporter domain-containing protein [Peteryoungia ipomoeae]
MKTKHSVVVISFSNLLLLASLGATHADNLPSRSLLDMNASGSVYLEAVTTFDADTGDATRSFRLVSNLGAKTVTLAPPAGTSNLEAYGLSRDGTYVVGSYFDERAGKYVDFIWKNGRYQIVDSETDGLSGINGVGNDGSAFGFRERGGIAQSFIWKNGVFTFTPTDPGVYQSTQLNARTPDGRFAVGSLERVDDNQSHAMIWDTKLNAVTDIDTVYRYSYSSLVSTDGSVVAGVGGQLNGPSQVFRWTKDGGMTDIGALEVGQSMVLRDMSADGNVLVGRGYMFDPNVGEDTFYAYRYSVDSTGQGTLTNLGVLYQPEPGWVSESEAIAVSADGAYVVGSAYTDYYGEQGFRWSEETGMQSIEEWLAGAGVDPGFDSKDAEFISDNGNVVMGSTLDGDIYVARVGDISGVIIESEFYPTVVQAASSAVQNSVSSANTVMFGAQGNPLRNRLGAGERSVWGTVDGGYDNSDISEGGLALGEFGLGYGITDGITARISVGGTYSDQDLDAGGWVKQRGFFLSPEVTADLGSNLFLTLGGYVGRADIDTARGYLNGTIQDSSEGSTNADTWAAKIRLDWLNAANLANTDITPYIGLSYARTTVDAFTEHSGAFPVSYDETSDHSTIARLGADFVHPVSDTVRLLAKTELSYQFEDHAAATSGTLTGISDFSIDGAELKQLWLRGGVGAEVDLGGGTASVMVNATTEGQDPSLWLRSNYTVKF